MSIWCQFDVNLMSIWCQFNVNLMSIWCQSDVNLMSIWCQFDVNLMSIWCQFDVNLKNLSHICFRNLRKPLRCTRLTSLRFLSWMRILLRRQILILPTIEILRRTNGWTEKEVGNGLSFLVWLMVADQFQNFTGT
jgi:hypothetical protein